MVDKIDLGDDERDVGGLFLRDIARLNCCIRKSGILLGNNTCLSKLALGSQLSGPPTFRRSVDSKSSGR